MRPLLCSLAFACMTMNAADWPTVGGSPQRDGWAKFETAFTRDNVKRLELLYTFKADAEDTSLTTPMIDTRIITYLGFKEMLVFAGNSGNVYSVDADLNRLIWKVRLPGGPGSCGGVTAPVAMAGSSTAAVGRPAIRPPVQSAPAARRPNRGGEFYAVASDGALHVLNTSTGADRVPPVPFVPANSKVSAVNVSDNVIYAATLDGCGGHEDALYAVDLSADQKKATGQPAQGGHIAGDAATAIGTDGFVFAQAANLHGRSADTVFKLTPKTMEPVDFFSKDVSATAPVPTPVVFSSISGERIVAAGSDGTLYLLDAKSLGGTDHATPLFATEPGELTGFVTGFATWEDPEAKQRWIYAAGSRGVRAFKADEHAAIEAWTSVEIPGAASPSIANGLVFVRGDKGLYALDSSSGKQLFFAALPPARSGIAVANRRIYVAGGNKVYCFGFLSEQPQLTGK